MKNPDYTAISSRRRRLLSAGASLPALAWAGSVSAQGKPPVLIGWLGATSRDQNPHRLAAFKEGMASFGWKEGVDYVLEARWAQGQIERLPVLAAEIAARKPALIVVTSSPPGRAAANAAPHTPIVMANGDPLLSGLAKSYARPGGMVTGLSNINTEIHSKIIELMRDAVPGVRRIGILWDASTVVSFSEALKLVQGAALQLKLDLRRAEASRPDDIEPALAKLAKEGAQALIIGQSAWFVGEQARILKISMTHRWPVIAIQPEFTDAGALASYGADRAALYRRAAYFVDRILKGTKPADLPIERPTIFETVVNLKTAKALGLTMPPSVMVRATRVIE